MNTKTAFLFTILTLVVHIINISAQSKPTLTVNASATIVEVITLSETTPMNFGTNSQTNHKGGTVILATNSNTRTYTGGLASGGTSNQKATNATFKVSGSSLSSYALILPESITLKHTSIGEGINTMNVTAIKASFNGSDSDATTSSIAANETDSFTLGATLNVQENQAFGVYSGTYNVSVNYN
jgi:hypothetical protein